MVIGAGGLGHIGIQCLKAMCAADVIVVDKSDASLALAAKIGADKLVKADGNEVEAVLAADRTDRAPKPSSTSSARRARPPRGWQ